MNLLTWPRGRPSAVPAGVSVLVPARDEEDTIEACVRAALQNPVDEVVVCDDGSTDATPAILARLAAEDPRVRVVRAPPLPAGWVGKVHACHVLAGAAAGEVLVLVDADVALAPDGVGRLLSLLDGAQVASALPAQRVASFAEGLLIPLLLVTYTSWLPLALVPRTRDPRILAANGQVLAVRRADHEAMGGFAAIRGEIVDDMAYCRRAKELGRTVVFADGRRIASCRMYRSGAALWAGFSKNLFEGLGESALLLGAVVALYLAAFVVPYGWAAAALVGGGALGPALGAVGANVGLRAALAVRYRHPWWSVVLHPVAVLVLIALAANSVRWWVRGEIAWRGRTYAPRARRGPA